MINMEKFQQKEIKRDGRGISNDFTSTSNLVRMDKDLVIKNLFNVNNTETQHLHGQKIALRQVVSGAANTHFARNTEYTIGIKDVTISRGVQLPKSSLAGVGKLFVIKDISGSASATTITVAAIDGETIDGEPTDGITSDWGIKRYLSDGSNWFTW